MDPARFYGRARHVNVIPGEGSQSDDECDSDSGTEYVPPSQFRFHKKSLVIPETDSDSSDEEVAPVSPPPKKKRTKQKQIKPAKVNWVPGKLDDFDINNYRFTGNVELPDYIQNLEEPAEFFKFLFTDELINTIVDQSNLKSVQDNINKPGNITKDEMEQFIGMVFFMSIVKLPAARLYWNTTIGQAHVYEIMTCNRFEAIKQHLHFNDNYHFIPKGQPGHDKLFKVRPLLEGIRKQLLLVPKEEFLAVDEQIIPTKMRHDLKQYNPAKPHKWGYKNQVLSGVSGFSYDFDIFAGDQNNNYPDDAPDLGVSGNVVTRLTETVPRHVNHKIFFDNWFNSPNLQVHLTKIGLLPLGTVRLNRVSNVAMPTEKELKKHKRGFFVEKVATIDDVRVCAITWYDNKPVNMLSTYVGSEPTTKKRRYCKKDKQYIEINCPQAIEVYNQHMGGVDLLDSMLGLYRIHLRSKKWYKRIFFHMLDMCIVNAWLLWRRKHKNEYMSLFTFKQAVSEHLCKSGKAIFRKRGRPSNAAGNHSRDGTPLRCASRSSPALSNPGTPTQPKKVRKRGRPQDIPLASVRSDHVDHMPEWQKKRLKCQVCDKKTFTKCRKCKVFLCYNDKRNCFIKFHE